MRPSPPSPNTHFAYTPAPGVIAFACGFTPPEPVALMRTRASTPPAFFLWTFERPRVGCAACLAAPASALTGAITGDLSPERAATPAAIIVSVECPRCRAIGGVACSDGGPPRERAHIERAQAAITALCEQLKAVLS